MDEPSRFLRKKVAKCFEPLDSSDKTNNKFRCMIENCNRVLCGKQPSNLTTHVKNCHGDFFQKNIKRPVSNPTAFAIKRLKYIHDCAEMIAINGCSFKLLCSSGFKNLVAGKVTELVEAGYGEGCTAPMYTAVRQHIGYQASKIEEQIKNEVKGKFVAVMADAASKNSKSFLGISLQYVLDGVIMVRSAGVIELLSSHTSINLMNAILDRLQLFEIEKKQVIAITTDNEASMISMVKRFNTYKEEGDPHDVPSSDEDDIFYDSADDEYETVIDREEDETQLNVLLDDTPEYTAMIKECLSQYALQTMDIYGIRCAAHTLQLAIREAMKYSEYGALISLFREVAKFLRKPTSIRIMREQGIKIWLPRLDCETRWSSLYRLVCVLIIAIIMSCFYSTYFPARRPPQMSCSNKIFRK